MSFHWFHDHMHDFTAQNTYKGLVSLYTLFSDDINLDTGDETTGLRLPSGEYDIPMVFADKVFDPRTGQLFFDLFNLDGILGDKDTVNGVIQPYLEVKRRKYRFRFLVGGPSRVYEFFLSNGQSFFQITSDGNLLPRPLTRRSMRLQVAERVDVIVDFSKAAIGEKIYLQNRLEQTGRPGADGEDHRADEPRRVPGGGGCAGRQPGAGRAPRPARTGTSRSRKPGPGSSTVRTGPGR